MRVTAMVNAHSHAFQIELRGIGERTRPDDDFWTWRGEMYRLAGVHDPDSMYAVGQRCYAEMAGAGYGAVGEFHYVHHQPDGRPYGERNAMAIALAEAALAVGLEIVLLPAAYHRGGPGLPPSQHQRRFCDPDVETFLERVDELCAWAAGRERVGVGVAVHSVRAVPSQWIEAVAAYAERHGLVRHIHACEQRRELAECLDEHGCTPIELLERCGFLGPRTSVVHGIHVSERDIALLASSGTTVVACPTTEGNLGDGYQPALAYREAGVRYAIGSDSQVRIDPFEETRELETGARRERETRHALLATADGRLWDRLVEGGRGSLGLTGPVPEVEIDLAHPDLAGIEPAEIPYALATCASAGVVGEPAPAALTHRPLKLLEFIERWLPAAPARVLEVGCGDGSLTRELISAGFAATGIDPRAPSGHCFQSVKVEDFRPPQPFDAAVAVGSLHHVADLDRAVASLHTLLRPGGRLVLSEFAVERLDDAARRWLEEHELAGALDHDYSDVIPLVELERALAVRFRLLVREPALYIAPELGREDLEELERDAIAQGRLRPVGMRLAYERD